MRSSGKWDKLETEYARQWRRLFSLSQLMSSCLLALFSATRGWIWGLHALTNALSSLLAGGYGELNSERRQHKPDIIVNWLTSEPDQSVEAGKLWLISSWLSPSSRKELIRHLKRVILPAAQGQTVGVQLTNSPLLAISSLDTPGAAVSPQPCCSGRLGASLRACWWRCR